MERGPDRFFQIGLALTIISFLFDLIAFVSPSWIEAIPEFPSQFQRLGLWVACFNNYIHPEDYVSKAYSGCWYVYYPEYYYIRSWLNPPWFYGVQMVSLVSFILRCVCLLIVSLMACKAVKRDHNGTPMKIVFGGHVFSTCSSIIVLILMGLKSRDRQWMPRPDQNRLSWGFGMAVIAGFGSIFAALVFGLILMRNYIKELHDAAVQGGYRKAPGPTGPPMSAPSTGYPMQPVPQAGPSDYPPYSQPPRQPYQPYQPAQPRQPYQPSPQAQPPYRPSTVSRPYPYGPTGSYQRPPPGSTSMPVNTPRPSGGGGGPTDTVV